ncbi:hypothetical protein VMF7928_04517 [Vibrio marisflavi CECT 7928]|uniref:Uncharacterized protein n=1 Tax=Vibrio marisflavi CECT 7928 TaxID=634439 RepID=A0ABM9A9P2_9VIBR|nr:hypothetical protein VMF7928_04517 [Vibrio marisflavi CECT 7928]
MPPKKEKLQLYVQLEYTECTRYARFSVSWKGALTPPFPPVNCPLRNGGMVDCMRC